MKIVHVSGAMQVPGIQQYVLTVAAAQKERGADVLVVASQPGAFSDACEKHGVLVVMEEDLELEAPGHQEKVVEKHLASTFRTFGAEVVHCHTGEGALKAVSAANGLGIPCVYTHHVPGIRALVVARESSLKFATISLSRAGCENLKRNGFPESELYYIPSGTKIMPRDESQPGSGNLIFVGRLKNVKGIDIAVLVMAELRRRHGAECPILNVYGEGNLREYAEEMVSVLRLDDFVRFHGARMGILEDCASTDILLMSSRAEVAGPLVVLEAMSRGMPIAASDVGEVAEMIPDRRYGMVAPAESVIGLADAVDSLLADIETGEFSPDLPVARHRELYSEDKMVERIGEVYKELIRG